MGHCHPRASSAKTRGFHTQLDEGPAQLEETPETPPSSRAEGLLFLHGLESNPGSSLQTEEEGLRWVWPGLVLDHWLVDLGHRA